MAEHDVRECTEEDRRREATTALLADIDALIREAGSAEARSRLRKLGFERGAPARLTALRARLLTGMDRRWVLAYERAFHRYGRGVVAVRDRVCSGCHLTLPTVARPRTEALRVCQSCGRILYWA